MRIPVLSTVVVAVALLIGAQMAAAQSSDEAAVTQAVDAFRTAMLKANRSQFEALCAEHLSYGHSAGLIETKAQFIDDATSGKRVRTVLRRRVVGHHLATRPNDHSFSTL